jgi:hypothetical protein
MTKLDGSERRREKRRPVLETFAFSIVIPKKGLYRLGLNDVSEGGIGFDIDIEGENPDYPVKKGDTIDFRFYVNRSLFIPLSAQIARIEEKATGRRIGAEFKNKTDPNYKAFLSILQLLEVVADVAQIDGGG